MLMTVICTNSISYVIPCRLLCVFHVLKKTGEPCIIGVDKIHLYKPQPVGMVLAFEPSGVESFILFYLQISTAPLTYGGAIIGFKVISRY